MPFIAPLLLSILVAQHACNWMYQTSVSGYFVHTYGRYGAEMWNPYISWFNPLFLVVASVSFVALLVAKRTWPRIDLFCRWPAGVLGIAAIGVGVFAITGHVVLSRALVPFGKTSIAVGLLLAATFKVLAVLVIWKAFKASSTAGRSGNVPKPSWKLLVVLATGVHLILPVRHYLVSLAAQVMPNAIPSWLWPHNLSLLSVIVDSVVALLLARFLLVRGAMDGVFSLSESRTVRIAVWFAVAFLALTPVAVVLSAIPYGGGGLPNELKSLLAVTEAIGIYLLYRGLVRGAA